MDSIHEAIEYLIRAESIRDWPELIQVLYDISAKPSPHWRIPEIVGLAVGCSHHEIVPAVAAIMAFHTSIAIVDDLLDGDDRFKSIGWNAGDCANLAQAITAAGVEAVLRGPFKSAEKVRAISGFNHMMVRTAKGQFNDTHTIVQDELDYWQLVQSKSGPFFETAFTISAILSGATSDCLVSLESLGRLYGEMVQIHDDLKDALSASVSADWQNQHGSLPILFARIVAHPQRDEFIRLYQNILAPGSLQMAQKILFKSGGVSYCVKSLLERGILARNALHKIALQNREPLEELFADIVRPTIQIFQSMAIPVPLDQEIFA